MAALAYLLLPLSGIVVVLRARSERHRFHGLQAIALGLIWAVALYATALVSVGLTQAAWMVGAGAWLALLVATAAGRDPRIPLVGAALRRVARSWEDESDT